MVSSAVVVWGGSVNRRTLLVSSSALIFANRHARAQSSIRPVVGFLSALSESQVTAQTAAFLRGLAETDFRANDNVLIEYRFADGEYGRLQGLARELVNRPVSLIMAQAPPAALAAKSATNTVPIVFVVGFDPVGAGLVSNLGRPGGNATGMTLISIDLAEKRLQLLTELARAGSVLGVLSNPGSPDAAPELKALQEAADKLKARLHVFEASSPQEVVDAFRQITTEPIGGLLVGTDPFFLNHRHQIVRQAAALRIPVVYPFPDFTEAGGLISYGTNIPSSYRRAGIYAGRILKGAKAGELPVMQPTSVELVINLKTARELGIDIPVTVHARADNVID